MPGNMQEIGELKVQVSSLERGYDQLSSDVRGVRSEVANITSKMHAGFTDIVARIDSKFENKSTSQWAPIGIMVTVLLAFGGALYWPIRETATKHEVMIETLRSAIVPRIEHERTWRDAADQQHRTEERLKALTDETIKNAREQAYLQGQLHPLSPGSK